ncbi:MAG: hypothetical protein KatS3mg130_0294 [Candidatus Sumerlaea sp.]|uniref:Uncharacterized protein n=1 Tax=Sumerlaea chitinivorans TaxID=2250252 RepID=A0A2Z4Y997_SUMC1|nr:hypothetical protein BRCON_2462 [Candidatus Sumerlaea chitinivorans]GIX43886.1 MAG: hypothetical protein KatS3mg130_0294 [Candidatus Sumerlaea sp.]
MTIDNVRTIPCTSGNEAKENRMEIAARHQPATDFAAGLT